MGKKILIIGGGIAGLSTAIRLIHKGYTVEVFEKENTVGGRVNQVTSNHGYSFDLTATVLLLPQTVYELFADIGLKLQDYLEITLLHPTYRVFYETQDVIDFSTNLAQLTTQLELFSKEDAIGYLEWLADIYKKYTLIEEKFLRQNFEKAADFLNPTTVLNVFKTKPFKSTYDYIASFIEDERIRQYLCFQAMFIGMNPYDSPNVYTLLPAASQLYGLHYIKGGMYEFVKVLEKLIIEKGGIIHTNSNVEKIITDHDKVKGIMVNNQLIEADQVIASADVPYIEQCLLNEKPKDYHLSCSTYILYLGINRKLSKLHVHNIYMGPDFKHNIAAAFEGRLPENPSVYIYMPTVIDETMAPKNCECLNITVRVPNLKNTDIDWNSQTKKILRDKVIEILRQITGVNNLEELIAYESEFTPVDMLEKFNAWEGSAFGLNHNLAQTNYFRPHHQSQRHQGLYFVGTSTHPGTGISLVLQSSKLVTQLVCHNS